MAGVHRFAPIIGALLLLALLAGCSLAGDITPPPALATAQAAAPIVTPVPTQQVIYPAGSSNLATGAELYAEHCSSCHGPQGAGDGELAGQLEFPPSALADPALARQAAPADWYRTVTNGNLERFMPPFASLSDSQRRDVAGYVLSLSLTEGELQAGEQVFAENCASCHTPPEFPDSLYSDSSRSEIFELVLEGTGAEMPGFGDRLGEEQIWAVTGYVQSLAWTISEAETVAEEPEPPDTQAVVGTIRNGTVGAEVPPGLQVNILGFDAEDQVIDQSVTANAQGDFTLDQVETVPGRLFFATLEYGDVAYRSAVGHAPEDGSPLELPLTIYETTSDAGALRVERLHLLFDFPQEGVMRVLQLWVVGNASDRVIAPGLQVALPSEAVHLEFEEGEIGERFEQTSDGFIDQEPVAPGSQIDQLVFAFDLPHDGSFEFNQPLLHRVDAVTVLVAADGPRLTGLTDEGVLDMGGFQMHSYSATALSAGDSLSFRVAGSSALSGQAAAIAAGAAALVIAGYVALRSWWRPAPEQPAGEPASTEELLHAIAGLDADYEAGRLSEGQWELRRGRLKQQAMEQMRASND